MKTKKRNRKIVRADVDQLIYLRNEYINIHKEIDELRENLLADMKLFRTKKLYSESGNYAIELQNQPYREVNVKKFEKYVTKKQFYEAIKVSVETAHTLLGEVDIDVVSDTKKRKVLKSINL